MLHTTHVEALDLNNLHPNLAAQWSSLMAQIAEAFQDESPLLNTEVRSAEVTLKVKLVHKLETRSTEVEAKLSAKMPGYRPIAQTVRLPHGGSRFLVEVDDAEQLDMYRPDETDGGVQ